MPRGPSGYCDKRPAPPPLRPEVAVALSLGNGSIPDCPLQPFGCKWPRSASLVVSRCPRKMPRPYGWELGPKHPKWFEPCPDPPPFTQGLGWRFNLRFGPGPDQCHLKGTAGVSWKRRVRHVCRACDPIVSGMRTHSSRNRKKIRLGGWGVSVLCICGTEQNAMVWRSQIRGCVEGWWSQFVACSLQAFGPRPWGRNF